jgi:hypothetical protein
MTDTTNFDIQEKVDLLIKKDFGFGATTETKKWYEETSIEYNNYINGEDIFLDIIPDIPDFDISGTVRTAQEIGLDSNNFVDYNIDINSKENCSIVDDSTGTVRRIKKVILEQTPNLGNREGDSWYKLDLSGVNILKNCFQFNFKQYTLNGVVYQPYLYSIYSQKSGLNTIPFGKKGGNWVLDVKSGILIFNDFQNFSNGVQNNSIFKINITDNKPVLTIYKYIGSIGLSNLNLENVEEEEEEEEESNINYWNMLQINSKNIPIIIEDISINRLTYSLIDNLSINIISLQRMSKFKILLNFNYLSSSYYDTLLGIALYYRVSNSSNTGYENLIGEYILGNENTSFQYDFFSNNFYINVQHELNDIISFYTKGKIISNTNLQSDYDSLNEEYLPKILFSNPGNLISVEEINLVQQILVNNYFNILQIVSTGLITGVSDEIIDYTSYELLSDLSLNLTTIKDSSKFKILLNFNYLASGYFDTFLNVTLFYKLNNSSETIIGDYKLGSENANFRYDFFSNNFYLDISNNKNDSLNVYVKAKIINENANNDYDNSSIEKPKILFSHIGNCLNIEEINN